MIKPIITLFITCILSLNIQADENISNEQAKLFISKISDDTISTISDKSLSDNEKEQKLTDLFTNSVDLKWIGKFALGRYYKTLSPEQKTKYESLFSKFLINNYVPNFRKYTKETIKVTGVSTFSSNEFMVQTEIIRPSKESIKVNYMIRNKSDNQYLIFDIIAEGVSLINTQRSEFNSLLASGDVNSLINMLEEKVGNSAAAKN
jgi:phospholipid transport system substrate-binding protein